MNPHPTKSKPNKIGRKHTGADGVRTSEKKKRAAKQTKQIKISLIRKYKSKVSEFWRGDLNDFPEKPKVLIKKVKDNKPKEFLCDEFLRLV